MGESLGRDGGLADQALEVAPGVALVAVLATAGVHGSPPRTSVPGRNRVSANGWDAQWDMLLALVGTLVVLPPLGRVQDTTMARVPGGS